MTIQPGGRQPAAPTTFDKQAMARFRSVLRGPLITQGDAEYETARRVYNGQIDKHPLAIARAADAADVVAAVNFARSNKLPLAVRAGGHNPNGFAVCDDGVVVDLSRMRGVRVDPVRRVARVDGGCTWGDVDHATFPFGLAVPGGIISSTGVAGLALGGGIGHLTRHYGLSIDNLVSADVVLADGRFVTTSETEEPDLFWAIRGGGGNFGVVTSFEFRARPAGTVLAGPLLYPLELLGDAMKTYREFMRTAPEELSAFFAVMLVPPAPPFDPALHNKTVCGILVCHSGDHARGEALIKPLRTFGPPLADLVGPTPFPAVQSMFDPLIPPGMQHYWKADFVHELTDEAIAEHVRHGPGVPTAASAVHIYPIDGAVHRVPADATAFSYRDAKFVHILAAIYPDPADGPKNVQWVRDYWKALHPHSAEGGYVNFMMDEPESRVRATYGGNYDRLRAVKKAYDPLNVFRLNQNIAPAP